jgi:hypothetical protein
MDGIDSSSESTSTNTSEDKPMEYKSVEKAKRQLWDRDQIGVIEAFTDLTRAEAVDKIRSLDSSSNAVRAILAMLRDVLYEEDANYLYKQFKAGKLSTDKPK